MSLSLLTPRLVSKRCLAQIIAVRCSSGGLVLKVRFYSFRGLRDAALFVVQFEYAIVQGDQTLKASETGFFKYERDISRDKRYSNPQKLGDTPSR